MNCLSDEKIQAYIDNELFAEEQQQVKRHIDHCPECKNRYIAQKQFLDTFLQDFNSGTEDISIPGFQYPTKGVKPEFKIKRLFWLGAAAVILFFLFVYSPNEEHIQNETEEAFMLEIDYEVDANKPWSEQDLTITIRE